MSWSLRIRAGSNLLWICAEQAIRLATTFLVGIWLARYLGASALGIIAFALSVVALPQVLVSLGLNLILKREWINKPNELYETIATAFLMRLGIGILSMVGIVFISIFWFEDVSLRILLILTSTTLLIPAFGTFELFFQNRLKVKGTFVVRVTASSAAMLLSVFLIVKRAPLGAFGLPYALEAVIIAIGFYWLFLSTKPPKNWCKGSLKFGLRLLSESWAPIVSAILVVFIIQGDHYFLKAIKGVDLLGVYSVAARLDKMIYFFPIAAIAAFFPLLARKSHQGSPDDKETIIFLQMLLAVSGTFLLVATISAPYLIPFLYGEGFIPSVGIWQIHAWTVPLYFIVAARGSFVARHKLFISGLVCHFLSAIVLALCLALFVQPFGTHGAAWSVVFSLGLNAIVFPLMDPKLRPFIQLVASALLLRRGRSAAGIGMP
jgi:O-antigen/teichoic acid export membrane protein